MNLVSCCLIVSCLIQMVVCTTSSAENEYCEFSSTQQILERRELKDFDNNYYILYELDGGYALYCLDGEDEVFMEGSFETNSPYYEINDSEIYYLGPGCYFYEKNNSVYDILSAVSYKKDDLDGLSSITSEGVISQVNDDIKINGAINDANPGKDTSDYPEQYSDYCLIDNYYYFQNLSYFPTNYFGTCGIVSLAMLLGYYDTFYNDNFIPNTLAYDSTTYDESKNPVETIEDTDVTQSVTIAYNPLYVREGNYPAREWNKYPGTTQALHDYLFDKCLSYNNVLRWFFGGYPMTQNKIKQTCKKYIENVSPELSDYIEYRCNNININNENIFLLRNEVMDYLDNDIPVILVMLMYSVKDEGFYFGHDAIAYGYNKKGQLLMHLGWNTNSKKYSSVVVNPNIPYGYFAIKYTGEHVHSTNAKCSKYMAATSYYGVCGCGYINNCIMKQPDVELY